MSFHFFFTFGIWVIHLCLILCFQQFLVVPVWRTYYLFRSSHRMCSLKKGGLKIFAQFTCLKNTSSWLPMFILDDDLALPFPSPSFSISIVLLLDYRFFHKTIFSVVLVQDRKNRAWNKVKKEVKLNHWANI